MKWSRMGLACLLLICILEFSCQKLEPLSPARTGPMKIEQLKSLDAIPIEYGNLVAVTTAGPSPEWAQLWFEKPDKTIAVVKVQWQQGYLYQNVTVFPRR